MNNEIEKKGNDFEVKYKTFWIDPPSGWKYGFPKVWDPRKEPDMRKWLLENNYKGTHIDEEWFYVRMWENVPKYKTT